MTRVFKNLFRYTSVDEVFGRIEFFNITLHKVFPDENFFTGGDVTKAVVNPVNGTVYLEKVDASSKVVTLKEWIESDGLCRTDTPLQNA